MLAEACKGLLLLLLLQVSVGRLGIITQLTFTIVPQQAVRRADQDMTVAQFAQQVKQVQEAYTQAKQTGSAEAVWAALHSLNETQASSPRSVSQHALTCWHAQGDKMRLHHPLPSSKTSAP